jgi:hypothetical protein
MKHLTDVSAVFLAFAVLVQTYFPDFFSHTLAIFVLRHRPRGNMKLSCTLIFGFINRWIGGRTDRQNRRR